MHQDSFDAEVAGKVTCAAGYIGAVTTSVCTSPGLAYDVSGCKHLEEKEEEDDEEEDEESEDEV